MNFKFTLLSACFFLIVCRVLNGQSLYQDVQNMSKAISILENFSDTLSPDEKAMASAEVLAILQNYDKPFGQEGLVWKDWESLLKRYATNPLVNDFRLDSLLRIEQAAFPTIARQTSQIQDRIKSGPRQKMVKLLKAEQAVSPAEYLSVSNAIEAYRLPPVPQTEALSFLASTSNQDIKSGMLLSEAAIVKGLFEFVLNKAKDEALVNFLDRLLDDETPNFQSLFPKVVTEFDNQDFTYSNSFVQRLRQAFYEDLQKLSVRLPVLLLEDAYFRDLQQDPVIYNLMATYSMVGLSQQNIPIDEVVPVTHRYLYSSFEEATKTVNLELSEKAFGSSEYDRLIELSREVVGLIKDIYLDFDDAEAAIYDTIRFYQNLFPGAMEAPMVHEYLSQEAYDLEVILGGKDEESDEFSLALLPFLLDGKLDSAYMASYNTLASYDKFFGKDRTENQWRAAGLDLAGRLSGTWYNEQSIADIYTDWQKDLVSYQLAVEKWKTTIDPEGAFQRAVAKVENNRKALQKAIRESKSFWVNSLSYDQGLALNALSNLCETEVFTAIDFDPDLLMLELEGEDTESIKLERKKNYLLAVEDRFIALDQKMYDDNPDDFRASPLRKYLLSKEITLPFAYILSKTEDLKSKLEAFQAQIKLVESKYSQASSKIRDNAKPIMLLTEVVSHLLYCLRTGEEENKWLSIDQLNEMLDGGRNERLFLGLMEQRLGSVHNVGILNPKGLTQLSEATIRDFSNLKSGGLADTLAIKDSLSFYRKAAFAVNSMNRILELPLFAGLSPDNQFTPLKNQIPGMSKLPDVSRDALDLIYYLNVKDHSHAVSSVIRLFSNMDSIIIQTKAGKRKDVIQYLKKYGGFIADLVDASTEGQVKDLLENVTDPPGSSRLKRKRPLTVGLNAYLGGTVGFEEWNNAELDLKDDFFSVAPTLPLGVTISGLFGKKATSLSLFFSMIDIGALLTYRPDSDLLGESQFDFKNVFRPGLQLHWNITKSPFYLGAGGHYGPQYRKLADQTTAFESIRYFMAFGIDVPIKTLYHR